MKNGFQLLKNWFLVLLGLKTWVGYHPDSANDNLPKIKKGVLNTTHDLKMEITDNPTLQRLNFLYARDYEPQKDWTILTKGFFKQ